MTALDEIRALVAIDGRGPGTDAERRAAHHLVVRARELGREVDVEPVDVWPRWPATYAVFALMAIVGSVLSVGAPLVGTALLAAALLLFVLDATGVAPVLRRLLGRRASQNVVSREDGGKPGTLVLVAHYDAGRTGGVFSPRLAERRAAAGRLLRRPIGPLDPFLWALLITLACAALRILGFEGRVLTAVQFVPTVLLIVSLPLLADIALSAVVPGANDNGSGVATVLGLGERYGGALEHFDVWLLLTGSGEAMAGGMRAFVRRHRKQLDRARTVFVNVDEVGVGTVRYTRREGPLFPVRSHVQLIELCGDIAEDDADTGAFAARPLVERGASDGNVARVAGFPAITICCRNALDYVPRHHQPDDLPEHLDERSLERARGFCGELIERLDADIGPELAGRAAEAALSED